MSPRVDVGALRVCEHGGGGRGRDRGRDRGVIDFSVNLNPYGPPDFLVEMLKAEAGSNGMGNEISHYPDTESQQLKARIADKFGCSESEVVVSAGISELIQLVAIGFVKDRVVIPEYTYGEYERAARMMGAEVKKVEMPGQELKPELISAAMQPGDVVFLCNPNNPTGQYIPEEGLELLMERAERVDALLVLDEAYVDFVDGAFPSHSLLSSSTTNLLILRSLTKIFTIPGVRVGYALGSEAVIEVLRKLKVPWSVSVFAQRIGESVLSRAGEEFIAETRAKILRSKTRLERELAIPIHSDANFYILDVGRSGMSASEVRAELLMPMKMKNHSGLAVRDCSSFGLPAHIRFSVQREEENEILVEVLNSLLL